MLCPGPEMAFESSQEYSWDGRTRRVPNKTFKKAVFAVASKIVKNTFKLSKAHLTKKTLLNCYIKTLYTSNKTT